MYFPPKRLFLALLLGLLAAGVVWLWPVRPLWMVVDTPHGRVNRFSSDGRWLYSTHMPQPGESPYLCTWDSATGELIHRTKVEGVIATPLGWNIASIRLSLDCNSLIVGTRSTGEGDIDTWHLHDAQTGLRRSDAIKEVAPSQPRIGLEERPVGFGPIMVFEASRK